MPAVFAALCAVLKFAWGVQFACFPILLVLFGLGTLLFCGRVLRYSPIVPARKVVMFIAVFVAVYLQIQLPILVGIVAL